MNFSTRREWIKGMALATLGSVVSYPLTAQNSGSTLALSAIDEASLNLWMGAIIPESKIPGAVSLGVPVFVKTMLKDCYEPAAQTTFQNVLGQIPAWFQTENGHALAAATAAEKEQFLFLLEKGNFGAEAQKAMATLKGLTIQGYTSTEYVLVNHLNYQMAPGFWNPCVPVKK
jgi:hypothetical protein